MKDLIDQVQNGGNIHHFCIIEGDRDVVVSELEDFCLQHLDFNIHGNPNYSYNHFDNLLVDDAKRITDIQSRKHAGGDTGVFVISCNSITTEAQNALLKVMEEPVQGNYFFMVLPYSNILLPTIVSRAVVIKGDQMSTLDLPTYDEITKLPIKDRMSLAADIVGDIKKEKINKGDVKKYINILLRDMNEQFMAGDKSLATALKDAERSVKYVDNKGASVKNILEHLMLLIPKI